MIVPRCCARCHVVISDRQRCPCIVCGACTTGGGIAGPGCACRPHDPGPLGEACDRAVEQSRLPPAPGVITARQALLLLAIGVTLAPRRHG